MNALDTVRLPARLPTPSAHAAGARWWWLLALSLLLHLLLLAGAGGSIGMLTASPPSLKPAPVVSVSTASTVSMPVPAATPSAAPERPSHVAAATTPVAPLAATPARRRPAQTSRPPPMSAPVTAPAPSANLSQVDGPAAAADLPVLADDSTGTAARQLPSIPEPAIAIADGSAIAKPAAAASDSPPATVPAVAAPPAAIPATVPPPRYRVSLPPSATLTYEVRYTTRGSITSGTSTVAWRNAADGYAIRGEVSKFGFTLSAFRSEGGIDDAGIAPILYAEKNARRAETNTHFLRDARQMISFSAATDSVALQPGAQDRASIPWQLAGIARGQRALLVPGTVLDVLVAGVRDAERWQIDVIGEETVDLDTGAARLWHLVRAPRSGSHDKRIDIWLAPDRQWYPVKLRYTEQNGDTLDLSLSALH